MINVKTIYEELEEINVKTGEERDNLLYQELFIINSHISDINDNDRKALGYKIETMLNETYSWKMEVILRAFLVDLVMSPDMAYKYLLFLKKNFSRIPCDTMYFLLCQIRHKIFSRPVINSFENKLLTWQLSRDTVDSFAKLFSNEKLKRIDASSRNKDLIFVLTNQFLGMTHGPTKTILDRCQVLIEKLNKKVVIINTSECLSLVGRIPLMNTVRASYQPNLCECSSVRYESLDIPFFQCENTMPDKSVIELLIDLAYKKKPEYIISIGGDDITSNLLSRIVPMLTVGLCPSALSPTCAQFQTFSGDITYESLKLLEEMNIPRFHIISSEFTWSLKPQEQKHSRKEVGLDDNDFVGAIVGARLDTDITDEFLSMLNEASEKYNVKYLVMGKYKFDQKRQLEIYEKFPQLKNCFKYIGFVSDILSYLELCDIFINPIRKGGGTSAIEALSKGVPVVTTRFGDIMTGVGEDFITDSYESMIEVIGKYALDKDYLKEMSEKALIRSKKMLDSNKEFVKTIKEFEGLLYEGGL